MRRIPISARRMATLASAAAVLCAVAWLDYLLPPSFVLEELRASRPYDAQVRALLAGRWDIPLSETGSEAIEVDGRYAVYFGPTPALLRLPAAPLVLRFPAKAGFVSLFLAAALGLWAAVRFGEELTGREAGPFEIMVLAGPVLVIASRASAYHEAIAWGGACGLSMALGALRYLRTPSLPGLAAVAACGAMAVLSRATWLLAVGALLAALAASALVAARPAPERGPGARLARVKAWLGWPDVARPRAHAALALAALALTVLALSAVGRAKFGSWSLLPPFERHVVYREPQRLARIGGGLFHLSNLPTDLYNYLSPGSVTYTRTFPWIGPYADLRRFPGSITDDIEHFMGLPHAMGALLLLAGVGVVSLRGTDRARLALPVAAALGLTALPLFTFIAFCGRYLYDFYPVLAAGSALGLAALHRAPRPWLQAAVRVVAAYNLAVALALAFAIQRDLGQTDRRAAVQAFAATVDALFRAR